MCTVANSSVFEVKIAPAVFVQNQRIPVCPGPMGELDA
jgi:hypothetical protein